ncbi:MAG: 23S rRNA (pseudouridine(1915)-N(3))-methyltransferase RlmH [Proteobacteria bacterium]|nr:23S rRNA (pseudouridine(1915)-N(3))-methyltransferase RlmH [Pseudomonadota bacterium]
MKIEIIKIGKCRHSGIAEVATEYIKRLKPYLGVESTLWKEGDVESRLNRLLEKETLVVALDERGKQWSSIDFSKKLKNWIDSPTHKRVAFVIGGPYGLPEDFRKKAHFIWSLSDCTLPSDFSWLLVCEQVYRAFTIIKGMAYHHE